VDDADLIPISALQHFLYCPRQCALIHLEQQWAESRHTAADTRAMMLAGVTPAAVYDPRRCDACSLIDLCQPRWLARGQGVELWLSKQLED
jgi:CRISPR/Cas system-associated exonuclease Cas4 (RecB family)